MRSTFYHMRIVTVLCVYIQALLMSLWCNEPLYSIGNSFKSKSIHCETKEKSLLRQLIPWGAHCSVHCLGTAATQKDRVYLSFTIAKQLLHSPWVDFSMCFARVCCKATECSPKSLKATPYPLIAHITVLPHILKFETVSVFHTVDF